MQPKRIYKSTGTGKVEATPFVRMPDGTRHPMPIMANEVTTAPHTVAVSQNFEIETQTNMSNQYEIAADLSGGMHRGTNLTTRDALKAKRVQVGLSLDFSGVADADVKPVLLFDGNGFISSIPGILGNQYEQHPVPFNPNSASYAAINAVITGTWSNKAINLARQTSGNNPFVITGVNVQAFSGGDKLTPGTANTPDSGYFTSYPLKAYRANLNATAQDANANWPPLASGDFQNAVRSSDDFNLLVDGFTGLVIDVPAGSRVVLTFWITSVADFYAVGRA